MLYYSDMPLDRGSNFRKNAAWLNAQMSAQSKWLLVNNNHTLFYKDAAQVCYLTYQQIAHLDLSNAIYLGSNTEQQGVFALDVSAIHDDELKCVIGDAQFFDIR